MKPLDPSDFSKELDALIPKVDQYDLPFGESDYKAKRKRSVQYDDLVETFSKIHGEDIPDLANWARAVMMRESGGNPNLTSPAGAKGLMQMLDGTFSDMGGNPDDIYDPTENIDKGMKFLAIQMRKYQDPMVALAAYNAGPGNVRKHGGIPDFDETKKYVKAASAYYKTLQSDAGIVTTPKPSPDDFTAQLDAMIGKSGPSEPVAQFMVPRPDLGDKPIPFADVPGIQLKADEKPVLPWDPEKMMAEREATMAPRRELAKEFQAQKPGLISKTPGPLGATTPEEFAEKKTGLSRSLIGRTVGEVVTGLREIMGPVVRTARSESRDEEAGRRIQEAMQNLENEQVIKEFRASTLSPEERKSIYELAKKKVSDQQPLTPSEEAAILAEKSTGDMLKDIGSAIAKTPGETAKEFGIAMLEDLPALLVAGGGVKGVIGAMHKIATAERYATVGIRAGKLAEGAAEASKAKNAQKVVQKTLQQIEKAVQKGGLPPSALPAAQRALHAKTAVGAAEKALVKPGLAGQLAEEAVLVGAEEAAITYAGEEARGRTPYAGEIAVSAGAGAVLGLGGALLRNATDARISKADWGKVGEVALRADLHKHPQIREILPMFRALSDSPEFMEEIAGRGKIKTLPEKTGNRLWSREDLDAVGYKDREPGYYEAPGNLDQDGRIVLRKGAGKVTLAEEVAHVLEERIMQKARSESVQAPGPKPYTDLLTQIRQWKEGAKVAAAENKLSIPGDKELFAQTFAAHMGYADKYPRGVQRLELPDPILAGVRKMMGEDPVLAGKVKPDADVAVKPKAPEPPPKPEQPKAQAPPASPEKAAMAMPPDEISKMLDEAIAQADAVVKKERAAREKAVNLTPRQEPVRAGKDDPLLGANDLAKPSGYQPPGKVPEVKIPDVMQPKPEPKAPKVTKKAMVQEAKTKKAMERSEKLEDQKATIKAQAPLREKFEKDLSRRKHKPPQWGENKTADKDVQERQFKEGFSGLATRRVPAKSLPDYFTLDGEVYKKAKDGSLVVARSTTGHRHVFAPDEAVHIDKKLGEATRAADYGHKEFGAPEPKKEAPKAAEAFDEGEPLPFQLKPSQAAPEADAPGVIRRKKPIFYEPPENIGTARETGDPPLVDRNVESIRAAEEAGKADKTDLLRDKPEKWEGLDPEIKRLVRDRSDDQWLEHAEKGFRSAAEETAYKSVVMSKAQKVNTSLDALQEAKKAGKSQESIAKLETEYGLAIADYIAHGAAFTNDGTMLGRALAARGRLIAAAKEAPFGELVRKLIQEIPGADKAILEDLLKIYQTDPAKFPDAIRLMMKHNLTDKIIEYWRAGMLSALVTDIRNVLGNLIFNASNMVERRASYYVDASLSKLKGTDRTRAKEDSGAEISGMVKAFPSAWKSLKQNFKDIYTLKEKPIDVDSEFAFQVGAIGSGPKAGKVEKVFGKIMRTNFLKLQAIDSFFKELIRAGEFEVEALRLARKDGAKGEALRKRVQEILREIHSNPASHGAIKKRVEEKALYRTFNDSPPQFARSILNWRRGSKWVNIIFPYVRTPANILKASVERTPLPLLNVFGDKNIYKAWAAWDKAVKSKTDPEEIARLQGEVVDRWTRVVTGSAFMGMVGVWASQGGLTGSGPVDTSERKALMASGWRPYSFVFSLGDGGRYYVSYQNLEPMSTLVGLVADAFEVGDEKTIDKAMKKAVGILSANILSKSYMEGASNFTEALFNPAESLPGYVPSLIGSLVPNVLARAATSIDPRVVDVKATDKGFLEKFPTRVGRTIASRIPGATFMVPSQSDVFGEEIVRPEGGAGFILPSTISPEKETSKLAKTMREIGYAPTPPSRKIEIEGEQVLLEASEYEKILDARKKATDRAQKLVDSPAFQRKGAGDKEDLLKQIFSVEAEGARMRLMPKVRARLRAEARQAP